MSISDKTTVLFANEAFYASFLSGDYETMETLWAQSDKISCIHPGWHHVKGRNAVMESWYSILTNEESPEFEIKYPFAHIYGETAVVVCYEVFSEAMLVATNIFVLESKSWKIVHHQSGGAVPPPLSDDVSDHNNTIQ